MQRAVLVLTMPCFNPRPSLRTGATFVLPPMELTALVSILARH